MKQARAAILALVVGFVTPAVARSAELVVAAAESLAAPLAQIGREFERAHPDMQLRFEFGASDTLLDLIVHGTTIDVLIPADDEAMDRIEPMMLPGTRRDIAVNRLVVIVPPKAQQVPATLADLAKFERIAIASPQKGPAGRYAKAALERAQLWTPLTPKLQHADSDRQVRDRVAVGEADAGFVFATDAAIVGERVKIAFGVPVVRPIRYTAAIVRASGEESAGRAFVEYLRTPPAREILRHYGFLGS